MPNSGLRKYTLKGGLLMLPPPPLAERGLSVSALMNSFCLAVCLSAGIGGKRVLSAALKRPGAAKAASNAIAMVFFIFFSLNVTGWPRLDHHRATLSPGYFARPLYPAASIATWYTAPR